MLTSVMAQSARMALGRYWSSFPVMSFVRLREKKLGGGDIDRSVVRRGETQIRGPGTHTPAGHNNDIISNGSHFSDCQINQPTKCHILGLKKFGDRKECLCSLS